MDDFEEKLNTILSSPETMEQIMAIAGSLGGAMGGGPDGESEQQGGDDPLDPGLLFKLLPLLQEYQSDSGEKQALLRAMKPFLRPESQTKLDKAVQITRLTRVLRAGMKLFRGDEDV